MPLRLIDVSEAAKMLACSERLVYKLGASGAIPRVKVGRLVRFRAYDVLAYVERQNPTRQAKIPTRSVGDWRARLEAVASRLA